MEVAQIAVNPHAPLPAGSEIPGSVNGAAAAPLFFDRLVASMRASDPSLASQALEGKETSARTVSPSSAEQPVTAVLVARMLPFSKQTTPGQQGKLSPEAQNSAMTGSQQMDSGLSSKDEKLQDLDDKVRLILGSSGRTAELDIHLKGEKSKENEEGRDCEGDSDALKENAGQPDLRTAVAVLQDIFRFVAPEASPAGSIPKEIAAVKVADTGSGPEAIGLKGMKDVLPGVFRPSAESGTHQQESEIIPLEGDPPKNGEKPSLDLEKTSAQKLESGDVADRSTTDPVTDFGSLTETSTRRENTSMEHAAKTRISQLTETVTATAGESNESQQRGTITAKASGVSRGGAVPLAQGLPNDPDQQVSPRVAEKATDLNGNGVESARFTGEARGRDGALPGDGSSRQESETGNGSREFSLKPEPAGQFEVVRAGSGEKLAPTSTQGEQGSLHENIMNQVREKLASPLPDDGNGQVTLRLNPRELGDLTINVRMENQKVAIDITAQNPVVKEALLQHLDTLKETLTRQNITMERFDVSTGTGHSADHSNRQGRQPAQHRFDEPSYPFDGYYQDEAAERRIANWLPRENALVDMRW